MNEFGTTRWGRQWLRLAEPVTVTRPDPQLPPARSLARRDRVRDLDAGPGRIRAVVDDGGPRRVELTFGTWDDDTGAVAAALDLSGELPERVAGAAVAPDEVYASCDCRARPAAADRGARCRHVLATLIETARRVDESPETALRLRGVRPRAAVVDRDRIRITDLDPHAFWE